jgi:UDP:flavonoid glycosyltransferase YjiC (YdhE family)
MVFEVLSEFPVTVIAATAGKVELEHLPTNILLADYLPMDIASAHSVLVISNGGSLTTYQALANSVPVIGLCSNMDQLLNMNAIERLGSGIALRAARVTSNVLSEAVTEMLDKPSHAQAAKQICQMLAQTNSEKRFRDFVSEILG